MSLLSNRTYLILPKDSPLKDGDALGTGPIPFKYPPPDVPVRLVEVSLRDRWSVKITTNGTYAVFAGRGQPNGQSNDYKWIVQGATLYASSVLPPNDFRFETAGDKLYHIGIPNADLLLTLDKKADLQLTFTPANGTDAQLFQVVPIERD